METLQRTVETWVRDRSSKVFSLKWSPPWRMVVNLPWPWPWQRPRPNNRLEEQRKMKEELESRKRKLEKLCRALKAETVADLQEILCCMVLSECVYKRPPELLRAVNKFKADFGGKIVSLERVQPSSDHVPHRYLLAESGDTLFASFIGTRQYKDVMADANIFQGDIFHEDAVADLTSRIAYMAPEILMDNADSGSEPVDTRFKEAKFTPKPAVHKGFMARAKGIPALELYRLAQKKRRKLVLCGHSLGGAVAVLATLAILRVVGIASKETEKVQVKCITFSQPPVGNSALRDYVNRKGWQYLFKTYCIPEDLVPRILSPAYFHHYNSQNLAGCAAAVNSLPLASSKNGEESSKQKATNTKQEGEQLVLGLGPVQTSFWRLSKLVPIDGLRRHISMYKPKKVDPLDSASTSSIDDVASSPQSLAIEEGSNGISLRPLPVISDENAESKSEKPPRNGKIHAGNRLLWRGMPSLPSYVPFGQLYILGTSAVESLSGSEYTKLTSVASVITELKERFQSHSMKSYRSRFQRIFDVCMNENAFSCLGREQELQFQHLQKMLGISDSDTVELGRIVDTPIIRAATSLVPLGWNGNPCQKNSDPLKVDISGYGLHLCTSVQVRVDGRWFSTIVESFPSPPSYSHLNEVEIGMQKIRVRVGDALRSPPVHQMLEDPVIPAFLSIDTSSVDMKLNSKTQEMDETFIRPGNLSDFVVFCTTDFSTIAEKIHVRTRRVQLIGLEGAGKTSLLKAILDLRRDASSKESERCPVEVDVHEGISGGLLFSESNGVNLQNLNAEISSFREELWKGIRDLRKKVDMVVLVHNLSHRVPRSSQSNAWQLPALAQLLDEAKSAGVPWVLAITNKFSVSAHQQKESINAVIQAYQASPSSTEVINSCPYVTPSPTGRSLSWNAANEVPDWQRRVQNLFLAPINLAQMPFQKRPATLPVEGVQALCDLIHSVLRNNEDIAFQELTTDTIFIQMAKEHASSVTNDGSAKSNSLAAATVGASVGAGVGILLAVVMGAASSLRKP